MSLRLAVALMFLFLEVSGATTESCSVCIADIWLNQAKKYHYFCDLIDGQHCTQCDQNTRAALCHLTRADEQCNTTCSAIESSKKCAEAMQNGYAECNFNPYMMLRPCNYEYMKCIVEFIKDICPPSMEEFLCYTMQYRTNRKCICPFEKYRSHSAMGQILDKSLDDISSETTPCSVCIADIKLNRFKNIRHTCALADGKKCTQCDENTQAALYYRSVRKYGCDISRPSIEDSNDQDDPNCDDLIRLAYSTCRRTRSTTTGHMSCTRARIDMVDCITSHIKDGCSPAMVQLQCYDIQYWMMPGCNLRCLGDHEYRPTTLSPTTLRLTTLRPTTVFRKFDPNECPIYAHEDLHAILDKLCGDCQDYFYSIDINYHVKCRANCFENPEFEQCWSLAGGDPHIENEEN